MVKTAHHNDLFMLYLFVSVSHQTGLDSRSFFFFIVGVSGGWDWAQAETHYALLDVCWSSALLVQGEPDEPNAGLGLTWYITWAWHVCLLIARTRPETLVLCDRSQICPWTWRAGQEQIPLLQAWAWLHTSKWSAKNLPSYCKIRLNPH